LVLIDNQAIYGIQATTMITSSYLTIICDADVTVQHERGKHYES